MKRRFKSREMARTEELATEEKMHGLVVVMVYTVVEMMKKVVVKMGFGGEEERR